MIDFSTDQRARGEQRNAFGLQDPCALGLALRLFDESGLGSGKTARYQIIVQITRTSILNSLLLWIRVPNSMESGSLDSTLKLMRMCHSRT